MISSLSLPLVENEILSISLVSTNRFQVESVDSTASVEDNDKKLRSTPVTFAENPNNTINEVPE